jgi:hypothetical protein
MADENQAGVAWKDADIAKALGVHVRTVERTREKCIVMGIEAALNHTRPKRKRGKVLDGAAEARLAQLAVTAHNHGRSLLTGGTSAREVPPQRIVRCIFTKLPTEKKLNSLLLWYISTA